MPRSWIYDVLYRRGAPWEGPARPELVDLVERRVLTPCRAIDLGCGSGANAIFLAERGFDVTGVDFSPVALDKARAAAAQSSAADRVRFIRADLTDEGIPSALEGAFDLVIDYGTLDDLRGPSRAAMARTVARLLTPGGRFLLWCFYASKDELPWVSFRGSSRLSPAIEPGEEERLFRDAFDIERLPEPPPGSGSACFLMTRR